MPRFVALLRGVNVGKAKRVPMAELRALLAELGCQQVQTLLNSGNAVFQAAGRSAPAHAHALSAALQARLGFEVPVIVKPAAQLEAIVAANPFAHQAHDPSQLLVAFTQDPGSLAALQPIAALVAPPEGFAVGAHAAYLHCAQGILQSQAGAALLGKLGQGVTTRNWATVLKLQALLSAA